MQGFLQRGEQAGFKLGRKARPHAAPGLAQPKVLGIGVEFVLDEIEQVARQAAHLGERLVDGS